MWLGLWITRAVVVKSGGEPLLLYNFVGRPADGRGRSGTAFLYAGVVGDLRTKGSAPFDLDVGKGLMNELAEFTFEVGLASVGLTKFAQVGIVQILYRHQKTLRCHAIVLLQPFYQLGRGFLIMLECMVVVNCPHLCDEGEVDPRVGVPPLFAGSSETSLG